MHVHIRAADGEAKFWLEPHIELALNHGLSQKQLKSVRLLVEEHENEIREAWHKHFGS